MTIDILTVDELSELLGLSENRILLLAKKGEIPHFRIDGRIRFDPNDIAAWIERLKNPGARPRIINHAGYEPAHATIDQPTE